MIAGIVTSEVALNTVKGVLWLLRSRFGEALGAPELLGRPNDEPGAPNLQGTPPKPQCLVDAKQVSGSPRRGVVLCLPRRRLQRWLLTEGRAWRERIGDGGGGTGGGKRWSPPWVEDGIDVMPPVLPGRANERGRTGGDGGSGIGDSGSPSRVLTLPSQERGMVR